MPVHQHAAGPTGKTRSYYSPGDFDELGAVASAFVRLGIDRAHLGRPLHLGRGCQQRHLRHHLRGGRRRHAHRHPGARDRHLPRFRPRDLGVHRSRRRLERVHRPRPGRGDRRRHRADRDHRRQPLHPVPDRDPLGPELGRRPGDDRLPDARLRRRGAALPPRRRRLGHDDLLLRHRRVHRRGLDDRRRPSPPGCRAPRDRSRSTTSATGPTPSSTGSGRPRTTAGNGKLFAKITPGSGGTDEVDWQTGVSVSGAALAVHVAHNPHIASTTGHSARPRRRPRPGTGRRSPTIDLDHSGLISTASNDDTVLGVRLALQAVPLSRRDASCASGAARAAATSTWLTRSSISARTRSCRRRPRPGAGMMAVAA